MVRVATGVKFVVLSCKYNLSCQEEIWRSARTRFYLIFKIFGATKIVNEMRGFR